MSRRQAGFTLVELLLAVTLMGLLLALAYGGLRAASRASESGQEVLAESGRLRITHQFVRKQLNLMLPLAFETSEEEQQLRHTFEGHPDSIVFVGPMPGYLARGGPQVQQMAFVEGESGLELHFSHASLQGFQREHFLDRDPVILIEGLQEGAFEFLEVDEEGLPTGWVDEWIDRVVLPPAVRVHMELGEESTVQWPQLVASARLDASAVIPGAGGDQTYAQRIQEMIQSQSSRGKED